MDDRDLAARWDEGYRRGWTPWDIGRPQPAFQRLVESGGVEGPALDSGCGTGEHTLLLAAHGIEAVGIDIAPTAIERARAKARVRGLSVRFVVGSVLELERLEESFET